MGQNGFYLLTLFLVYIQIWLYFIAFIYETYTPINQMDESVSCYHLQWILLQIFFHLGNDLFNTLITKE